VPSFVPRRPAHPRLPIRAWLDPALLGLHRPAVAWTTLAISIFITALAWYVSDQSVRRLAEQRFAFEVDDATAAIGKRLVEYEQMLRGGVGLFNATHRVVTRREWHDFVQTLAIDRYFPGIQGIGFAPILAPAEVPALVASVRAEGFRDFDIRPAGVRDTYSSIIYLEPFTGRNLRAFGFDMLSEEVRRTAIVRAIDDGQPAASGRVTLVQEADDDPQPGFLLYLPVYRHGARIDSLEDRRGAIVGVVYAPFRMGDLMDGILPRGKPLVSFVIHDGRDGKAGFLYDSGARNADQPPPRPRHVTSRVIDVAGHHWALRFAGSAAFEAATASHEPALIAFGGLAIDLVLFGALWSLVGQQRRVEARVADMTREIQAGGDRVRQWLEQAPQAMVVLDEAWRIALVNRRFEALLAIDRNDFVGAPIDARMPGLAAHCRALFAGPADRATSEVDRREAGRMTARRSDGLEVPLEVQVTVIDAPAGRQYLASLTDTSERDRESRALEAALEEKTLLLNEVHHRVKNNLQVVCSMLSLQAAHTSNDDSREVLNESHARVQAMGLIHQLLYEGGTFSHVQFGQYLDRLARLLHRTAGSSDIQLVLRGTDLPVPIELERAVSCGLVINELVVNAFKHAFHGRIGGTVTIEVSHPAADEALIVVADDGVGMPFSATNDPGQSLGLRLVPLLLEQARARMTLVRGHGTRYEIRLHTTSPVTHGVAA